MATLARQKEVAMNEVLRNPAAVSNEMVTRGPLPGSRKRLVNGVPFREVPLSGGEPSILLYDTSGPYTDDTVQIDIARGLAPRRSDWIQGRGDVERYAGRERLAQDDGLKPGEVLGVPQFDRGSRQPLRARAGCNVTQLHYARQGLITDEMRFVAARENLGRSKLRDGNSFGAAMVDEITP